MTTSYEITKALVADHQATLRQEARLHRLVRRARGEQRRRRHISGGSPAA